MLGLKNILLNLLLAMMLLSITAYADPKNKVAGYYETEDFLGYIKELAEESL
jgi:uncharacterized membrane protein